MRALLPVAAALSLVACKPDFAQPASLIVGPRILAVRAAPPEALPGGSMRFEALAVAPSGTLAATTLRWAFCSAPKPLTENNVVGPDCLGSAARPLGQGAVIAADLPADACLLFGPETPPQQPGQPPFRPRDPDVTGGYYQPLRLDLDGEEAIAMPRITCNLTQASADVAREYRERYRRNQNPQLRSLDAPATAARGQKLDLRTLWQADDAERYVVYDVATQALVERREALRVSWFATAGSFESEISGRPEDDMATFAANRWTAPAAAGTVHLWAVLRDSRGGSDWKAFDIEVR